MDAVIPEMLLMASRNFGSVFVTERSMDAKGVDPAGTLFSVSVRMALEPSNEASKLATGGNRMLDSVAKDFTETALVKAAGTVPFINSTVSFELSDVWGDR